MIHDPKQQSETQPEPPAQQTIAEETELLDDDSYQTYMVDLDSAGDKDNKTLGPEPWKKKRVDHPEAEFLESINNSVIVGLSLRDIDQLIVEEPPTLEAVLSLCSEPLSSCKYAAFQAEGRFNTTEFWHLMRVPDLNSVQFSVSHAGTSPAFAKLVEQFVKK